MTPRLPPCTLFPYTTLFRSAEPACPFHDFVKLRVRFHRAVFVGADVPVELVEKREVFPDVADRQFVDRKSTRLNSSHITISYAVSCLKKKKTSRPTTTSSTS